MDELKEIFEGKARQVTRAILSGATALGLDGPGVRHSGGYGVSTDLA
jgi:hypothetical protein